MRKYVLGGLIIVMALGLGSPVAAQDEEIAGVWQSIGYGLWFKVETEAVDVYQTTAVSCVRMLEVPQVDYRGQSVTLQNATLTGLGQYMGAADYELTLQDGLLNFEVGKLNPIQAKRAESLPAVCDELTANTPTNTFETFWHMFNENYAFFDLHGVDWQAAYDQYRPRVTDETSDAELFAIFQAMLTPLEDGHVSINSETDSFSPIALPAWFDGEDEEAFISYALLTANQYLLEEPQFVANQRLVYGHLSDKVGYIGILGFEGFSEEGDDIAVLRESLAQILADFQGVEAIVIDVRFNPGGDDANGLFVAGHFTDETHLAFNKSVWFNQAFYPLMDVFVEPATEQPFMGEVYVLTSGLSVSAAETFALAMSTLPNVKLVGEPTNGILSDMWFAMLPNGWIASLSNERYLSSEGVLYEGVGIPPDIEVSLSVEAFTVEHNDPIVKTVLELVP